MKKTLVATCSALLIALPLYAQNTTNTAPSSGDPSFDSTSTMQEGSGTIDSFERETSTSPGSGRTTTLDDPQEMEETHNHSMEDDHKHVMEPMETAPQDNTDMGSGVGTGTEVQDDTQKTPDDWEEEE